MVLTVKKKLFLLAMAFFLNAFPTFPWISVSGLIQYGENIDRERLDLLDVRQVIRMDGGVSIAGTYKIRNAGGDYFATLGLLITGHQGDTVGVLSEVYFYVDGRLIPHTDPVDVSGFVMGETRVDFRFIRTSWILIDVLFPANSTVTIQVSYRYLFGRPAYNATMWWHNFLNDYVPNLPHWGGSPSFGVEIINDSLLEYNVERSWISNIIFEYIGDRFGNIDTMVYLQSIQGLETDLMKIQRPNGNTIKIEFTQEFLNNFHRSLFIEIRPVGENRSNDGRQYFHFPYRFPEEEGWISREIHLQFLGYSIGHFHSDHYMNITRRVLAPYELIFLTASQLRIMRNAFFARHGFIFQSEDLRNFFGAVTRRYEPNPNFHAGMLTDIDRANIAIIQRLEALVGD